MSKPFIFISCGQYTPAEKALGIAIVKMVKSITGMDAFFAEAVQDLNGLDSNILDALRDCAAFITVLHPRGKILRPDGSEHVRASVWIEQEIAMATYIARVEKRTLPVVAFIHTSVGREGIRDLLHLNPIPFNDEQEVLAKLPDRLRSWQSLTPAGIYPEIVRTPFNTYREQHLIRQLQFRIANRTNSRLTQFSGILRIPAGILSHWSNQYGLPEEKSDDPDYRIFRFDENAIRPIQPQSTANVFTFDYCITCGLAYTKEDFYIAGLMLRGQKLEITVFVDGRQYQTVKTLKELAKGVEPDEDDGFGV